MSGTDREIGVQCDVDECDSQIVGLHDGWEFSRGTVCQDCIDYNERHGHWPDEDPHACRQCVLDDGGEVHDCPESSFDVLLRPGDDCHNCGFELAVTDGGTDADGTERACPNCDVPLIRLPDSHEQDWGCSVCHGRWSEDGDRDG